MNRRGTNVFVKSTKSLVDNGCSLSDLPPHPPFRVHGPLYRSSIPAAAIAGAFIVHAACKQ